MPGQHVLGGEPCSQLSPVWSLWGLTWPSTCAAGALTKPRRLGMASCRRCTFCRTYCALAFLAGRVVIDVVLQQVCQMLLVESVGQKSCWACVGFRRLISTAGTDVISLSLPLRWLYPAAVPGSAFRLQAGIPASAAESSSPAQGMFASSLALSPLNPESLMQPWEACLALDSGRSRPSFASHLSSGGQSGSTLHGSQLCCSRPSLRCRPEQMRVEHPVSQAGIL